MTPGGVAGVLLEWYEERRDSEPFSTENERDGA
jgi:hypothetical protein